MFWTAAGIVRQNERMDEKESENVGIFEGDRPKGALEVWKRDSNAQMIRQSIQEYEQMITTEGQIISSGKERMILEE